MALKRVSNLQPSRRSERPQAQDLTAEEQSVYDFVSELLQTKRVSDATYAHAATLLARTALSIGGASSAITNCLH